MKKVSIVARSSKLSRIQVEEVLSKFPSTEFDTNFIDSLGDKQKHISLMDDIPGDFFTREIDSSLLNERADIAIHSAKDLPYPLTKGLEVIALTEAFDQTDALCCNEDYNLDTLPEGSVIGTSSEQRKMQILKLRPDLQIKSIRGTIQERLEQLDEGKYNAVIVATCALIRLGIQSRIKAILPFKTHPLQGNLAIVAKKGNFILKQLFKSIDIRRKYGKGYIVGAGPGDPELITMKARRIIDEADVILYDNLANPALLNGAYAQTIYVGKRKGNHTYTQDEINELFYKYIAKGKKTVRLKGGDPMIFGRGGEEFDYIRSRLADVEIIPGISAAIGASSVSAIPLTYRNQSASVAFMTGYPENKIAYPDTETLVYYMGASNAHTIASELIKRGRVPETPVAIIRNATLPNEEKQFTSLAKLAKQEIQAKSPSVLIIGETAKDNNFDTSDADKKNILFTGTDSSKYQHLGNIIHTPLITLEAIEYDKRTLDQLLTQNFHYVIFTSKYAVKYFTENAMKFGYDNRWFAGKQIISIGETTTKALRKTGIIPDEQMTVESSTGIISWFNEYNIRNKKVLIPRSNKGLDYLPEELSKLGLEVQIMHAYKNAMPKNVYKHDLEKIDGIIFTSPSTVDNYFRIYEDIPEHIKIISRGEQTTKRLHELRFELDRLHDEAFNSAAL